MSNLPVITQLTVVFIGAIYLFFMGFVLLKRGGKIEYKNYSFAVGHKATTDKRVAQISEYMNDKLASIRQCFFGSYLKLLKDEGCLEELLVENEDSQFYAQMLGNIVYSGNGIHSIKSILEKAILDGSLVSMEFNRLMAFLLCSIEENARTYINRNYSSIIRYTDGSERCRTISNTELVDSLPSTTERIRSIINEITTFARDLYKEGK